MIIMNASSKVATWRSAGSWPGQGRCGSLISERIGVRLRGHREPNFITSLFQGGVYTDTPKTKSTVDVVYMYIIYIFIYCYLNVTVRARESECVYMCICVTLPLKE